MTAHRWGSNRPRYGDMDGCGQACWKWGAHTRKWGECEWATEPGEPTVSMSRVYTDALGHLSIGFDVYTVDQLAAIIEPVLMEPEEGGERPFSVEDGGALARRIAEKIINRNKEGA